MNESQCTCLTLQRPKWRLKETIGESARKSMTAAINKRKPVAEYVQRIQHQQKVGLDMAVQQAKTKYMEWCQVAANVQFTCWVDEVCRPQNADQSTPKTKAKRQRIAATRKRKQGEVFM